MHGPRPREVQTDRRFAFATNASLQQSSVTRDGSRFVSGVTHTGTGEYDVALNGDWSLLRISTTRPTAAVLPFALGFVEAVFVAAGAIKILTYDETGAPADAGVAVEIFAD